MITPDEDGYSDGSAEEDDCEDPAAAAVAALVRPLPPDTRRHYQLLPPATAQFPSLSCAGLPQALLVLVL